MREYYFKRSFTGSLTEWFQSGKKIMYVTGPRHIGKETNVLRWLKHRHNLLMYAYNEETKETLLNLDKYMDSLLYKDIFYGHNNILVIFNAEELKDGLKGCVEYISECDKIKCKILIVSNVSKYDIEMSSISNLESMVVNTLSYSEFEENLSKIVFKHEFINKEYYELVGGYPKAIVKFIQGISYNFSKSILLSSVLSEYYNMINEFIRDIAKDVYVSTKTEKEVYKLYEDFIENILKTRVINKNSISEYLLDIMILVRDNDKIRFNNSNILVASILDRHVYYNSINIDISIERLIEMNKEGFEFRG